MPDEDDDRRRASISRPHRIFFIGMALILIALNSDKALQAINKEVQIISDMLNAHLNKTEVTAHIPPPIPPIPYSASPPPRDIVRNNNHAPAGKISHTDPSDHMAGLLTREQNKLGENTQTATLPSAPPENKAVAEDKSTHEKGHVGITLASTFVPIISIPGSFVQGVVTGLFAITQSAAPPH